MTIVLLLLGALAFVAYEVRADRKVRRSTAGATPVVIVRGLKPRWWRGLLSRAAGLLVGAAVLFALLAAAMHVRTSAPSDPSHAWPFVTTLPSSSSTSSTGKGR